MKKKKNIIDSTEPINNIADVDRMIDAFVERGGYITLNEDLKIRKRIPNRNNLASWIMSVKNKLIYKKEEIIKKISESRVSKKKKKVSKSAPSPIVKPVKEEQKVNVVTKHSLIIDSYSNICKDDSTLRSYQQKAKREIFESWEEVDSVMFQMPTGTGKTRLFTSIINDINKYSIARKEPVRILIIAHRTELIDQIDKSLDRYKVAHNIIAGGNKKDYRKPVNVASIQTLTHPNNLERAKMLNVQFVIIDEAHHALAKTYKKLWDLYPNAKRLGVTATPWRMNHQSFTDLFDKIIISMPVKEFIKEGFLAPYKYFSLKGDSDIQRAIDGIELDRFGEYMESSMEEKMDIGSIRAQLLDSYLALAEGKKGIIYAINIEHANHICEEYKRAGYNAVSIDSKTPAAKREELVKKFKRGLIDIIVNVDIFSEGFDCPDIEFIQLARPTRSLVKYLQQVGRGLRITENKQHCVILDNVGMYSRFGLPDARRHWKAHFLGKNIDETPTSVGISLGGSGRRREVDMSEGTEDMELIQDDYKDIESMGGATSAINDFFPLFGVTLGKTTWKDVEDMGYDVNIWKNGPKRYTFINGVTFWDHKGEGVFANLYWTRSWRGNEMPSLWEANGFSWDYSYEEWLEVFQKLGYAITVREEPSKKEWDGRTVLSAKFDALSPDSTLEFDMDFDYGEDGHTTSSPNTLYGIKVSYHGELAKKTIDIEEPDEKECDESVARLYYDNNGVSYEDGKEVLIKYPNGSQYNSIEVPEFITNIKTRAFKEVNVSEIILHDGIQELQGYLFEKCLNLKTITMKSDTPDDILIDKNTFKGFNVSACVLRVPFDSLEYYKCDERFKEFKYITAIEGSRCLMYNEQGNEVIGCEEEECENIVIPEGVTSIKEKAFEGIKKIKTVFSPDSLLTIGKCAFRGCSGITKIRLNDKLEEIHYDAFRWTGLTEVEIPSYVNFIGVSAFNCDMNVSTNNTHFFDLDGVLCNYLKTKLIIYPSNRCDKHFDVKDGIMEICRFAFEDSLLQSISLPDSIEILDSYILSGCENLTKLTIHLEAPNNIEIDEKCFCDFDKSKCKLIVPEGCKDNYSSHEMFNDFLTIEEITSDDDEQAIPEKEQINTVDEDEIEIVHVGIPTADPYIEVEVEADAPKENEIKKVSAPIDPTKLDRIFDKKASSYKYFWFMAIISLAQEKKNLTISYKDILIRMAAMAWPIIFVDKINLGAGDMIPKYLNDILKQSPLTDNTPSKVVEAYLKVYYESEGIDKRLSPLLKNVPYRFLSPWIRYTNDEEVIEESNSYDCACLYALHDDHIILNEKWWDYISKHYSKICGSVERSFILHAKQKNRNNRFTHLMATGWSLV